MPFVYIAHLEGLLGDPSNPKSTAGHYTGSKTGRGDWREREEEHRDGTGSKLLRAANERGIPWRIVQVWELLTDADAEALEKLLKARAHIRRRCLYCLAIDQGEIPPVEPVIVLVADLNSFTGRKPIAEVIETRQRRLNRRRQLARAEAAWFGAVHADLDASESAPATPLPMSEHDPVGTIYGDCDTWWPLELIGPDFDIEAWRRGELDAIAHEIERVRRARRND